MKSKYILILISYFSAIISSQDLEDLSFGDEYSLDIATWNIEWFPKNNQITVDYVIEIINSLEFDILGIQELDDTTMFNEMLDSLPSYSGYYESSWFAGLAYIYKTDLVDSISIQINSSITNTQSLGNVIYTDYIHLFQLSGMILLVAMIGAIVLTYRQRTGVKRQSYFKQISREKNDGVELVDVESNKGVKIDV